jgi:hypothetical protein
MTLFGKGRRETVVDSGAFHCPACGVKRDYVRKTRENATFFLGVAVSTQGHEPDLIECTVCGNGYNTDVLDFNPSKPRPGVARLLGGVKQKLAKGYTPAYILQDLIDQGVERETAQAALDIAQKE